jgi:nitroimidazol reductase NimA-like FMN-containing flavoprotein (pyridoxamine 5'-phosphate oxidase superfamily)
VSTKTAKPTFRILNAAESEALLSRHNIGRIAYAFHERVDIEPIHYVYADGAIYMRTAPGSKLAALSHAPWIALETDEVDGPFDWRSVVVHGTVYALRDEGSPIARSSYRRAVDHLRTLMPLALCDGDPTPARTVVLQVHPDVVTGREARTTRSASAHRTATARR